MKTDFYNKDFALSLALKAEVNSEMAYSVIPSPVAKQPPLYEMLTYVNKFSKKAQTIIDKNSEENVINLSSSQI